MGVIKINLHKLDIMSSAMLKLTLLTLATVAFSKNAKQKTESLYQQQKRIQIPGTDLNFDSFVEAIKIPDHIRENVREFPFIDEKLAHDMLTMLGLKDAWPRSRQRTNFYNSNVMK